MNICKQLHKGWHYAVDRTMGLNYLTKLNGAFKKNLVEVRIVDISNRLDGNGSDAFVWVANDVVSPSFQQLNMTAIQARMKEDEAIQDPGRGNLVRNFGFCGVTNSQRSECSLGLPKPNIFKDTSMEWVVDVLVAATAQMTSFSNEIDQPVFVGDAERQEHFAGTLAPNGTNKIEAITLHQYEQKVTLDQGCALSSPTPWCNRAWDCLCSNNKRELTAMQSIVVETGPNLLGCHTDNHNDKSDPNYSYVFNAAEFSWEDGSIWRTGVSAYGKQDNHIYMTKYRVLGPVLKQLKNFYQNLPLELKEMPHTVALNESPRTLSGCHINKLGAYHAMFLHMITRLLSSFCLSQPHRWAIAFTIISTKAAHKPVLFYNVALRVLHNPNCYGTHITKSDMLHFIYSMYEELFEEEHNQKNNNMVIRMQPFHNSKMTKPQLSIAIDTIVQCAVQMQDIGWDAVEDDLANTYHQIVCILIMSSALKDPDNKSSEPKDPAVAVLKEKYGVMGVKHCGSLSVHNIIALGAGLGFFPTCMLGHAEIPPNTGYHKIVECLKATTATMEEGSSATLYQQSQDILKATESITDETISTCEELFCQTHGLDTNVCLSTENVVVGFKKNKATGQQGKRPRRADIVWPGVKWCRYNKDTKKAEAWTNPLHGEKTMVHIEPLSYVKSGLQEEMYLTKCNFFKASWPQKQKNYRKQRTMNVQIPYSRLCPVRSLGTIKERDGTHASVEVVGNEILKGSCDLILHKKGRHHKYRLDINEPPAHCLLTKLPINTFSPQTNVQSRLGHDDIYHFDHLVPPHELLPSNTNTCDATPGDNPSRKRKTEAEKLMDSACQMHKSIGNRRIRPKKGAFNEELMSEQFKCDETAIIKKGDLSHHDHQLDTSDPPLFKLAASVRKLSCDSTQTSHPTKQEGMNTQSNSGIPSAEVPSHLQHFLNSPHAISARLNANSKRYDAKLRHLWKELTPSDRRTLQEHDVSRMKLLKKQKTKQHSSKSSAQTRSVNQPKPRVFKSFPTSSDSELGEFCCTVPCFTCPFLMLSL